MVTEDFVSFEIAKLLKEKGFDGECFAAYNGNGKLYESDKEVDDNTPYWSDAPTLQMAMKWLREVHKLGVFPSTYTNIIGNDITDVYGTAIVNLNTQELMTSDYMARATYEEACDAAIRYCLENLI